MTEAVVGTVVGTGVFSKFGFLAHLCTSNPRVEIIANNQVTAFMLSPILAGT